MRSLGVYLMHVQVKRRKKLKLCLKLVYTKLMISKRVDGSRILNTLMRLVDSTVQYNFPYQIPT
jgi:hypothetical protein